MKLPALTAERALGHPLGRYRGGPAGPVRVAAITPQTSESCLSACVGPGAATKCAAECGSNLTCWRRCADITDTSCVAACYRH